jgi:hypothetical protein
MDTMNAVGIMFKIAHPFGCPLRDFYLGCVRVLSLAGADRGAKIAHPAGLSRARLHDPGLSMVQCGDDGLSGKLHQAKLILPGGSQLT